MRSLALALGVAASTAAYAQQPALAQALAAPPKAHPRLFLDAARADAMRQRIAAEPTLRAARSFVIRTADAIESARPVVRQKVGKRLLGVSRTCLKRVTYLTFAHWLTGNPRYAARAQREMLAAAAFEDWNPSHFLDVGEMTAALAIGYDGLHDAMEPAARATIREAIVEHGLRASLAGGWWVTTTNNWNQVCHGGLTLGALAVIEDERELAARIIERACANLPRAMREYEPHGAYPEGPGYWLYGTTFNVLMLDALQSALGSDFGLSQAQGFAAAGDYILHVTGPTGLFFNYSDGGAKRRVSPAMQWFAAQRSQPTLLWQEKPALDAFLATAKPTTGGANRLLPFLLLWSGKSSPVEPGSRHWRADGKVPVTMHRSSWDADATFIATKGGAPNANHGHMDIGSFVLDADGVRWAHDLGSQSYNDLEQRGIRLWDRAQNSARWSVFRLNNHSHNTLVVDGALQRVNGRGEILTFETGGAMPHTVLDLSAPYAGQLRQARRGFGLRGRNVIVQDEVATLADRESTTVRWGMVTAAIARLDGASATLEQAGQVLQAYIVSPPGAEWTTYDVADPPAEHDAPNRGMRMLGFEVEVRSNSTERLTVHLMPGAGNRPDSRTAEPLAAWPKQR
ncbi:MAG: heparinase II/III-family protein [bacterium]|nr:heparinase II/III-family protein [bacterium]